MTISDTIIHVFRNFNDKSKNNTDNRIDIHNHENGEEIQALCSAIESQDRDKIKDFCRIFADNPDPKLQGILQMCNIAGFPDNGTRNISSDDFLQDQESDSSGFIFEWSAWIIAITQLWYGNVSQKNNAALVILNTIENFSFSDESFDELLNQVSWDFIHEEERTELGDLLTYLIHDRGPFLPDNSGFVDTKSQIVETLCLFAYFELHRNNIQSASDWLSKAADILEE